MQFLNMRHGENKVAMNGAAQYIELVSSSLLKKLDLTRSFNASGFFLVFMAGTWVTSHE
jgi:hypothetical protein